MEWTQADEKIKNDIVDFFDKDTTCWIEEKAKDIAKIMSYYRCAMMEIETKFKVLNIEYSLKNDRNPISSIKTRLKDMQSIRGKFERKSIKMSLEALEKEINDIAGVRVICSFPADVYEIAEALLKQDDVRFIEMKDYIKNPKPNGYRSLHIIVEIPIFLPAEKKLMKVEIQLRTIAMDFWASLEHQLHYKTDNSVPSELSAELKMLAETIHDTDMKMEDIYHRINDIS
jgi:putative GTP pyrophosphokinase